MKKLSAFASSVVIGASLEITLCAVAVILIITGGMGPCGPSGDFPAWLTAAHVPGVFVSSLVFPDPTLLRLPIIVVITAAQFSLIAWFAFWAARESRRQP